MLTLPTTSAYVTEKVSLGSLSEEWVKSDIAEIGELVCTVQVLF